MSDLVDFGRYAPYIVSAYGVSILALAGLILARRRRLRLALEAERAQKKKN